MHSTVIPSHKRKPWEHNGRLPPIMFSWLPFVGRLPPIMFSWLPFVGRLPPIMFSWLPFVGRLPPIMFSWLPFVGRLPPIMFSWLPFVGRLPPIMFSWLPFVGRLPPIMFSWLPFVNNMLKFKAGSTGWKGLSGPKAFLPNANNGRISELTWNTIYYHKSSISDTKSCCHLRREVNVAWRVNQVNQEMVEFFRILWLLDKLEVFPGQLIVKGDSPKKN